jgi:hypothetical protein
MKALTVCQPYAEMLARGPDVKPVENRSWPTRYRGLLAIHAGKSQSWLADGDADQYPGMAFGAFVAVGRLIGSPEYERLSDWKAEWMAIRSHPETGGPFCWILVEMRRLAQPVPCRGAQGLWDVPRDLLPLLTEDR